MSSFNSSEAGVNATTGTGLSSSFSGFTGATGVFSVSSTGTIGSSFFSGIIIFFGISTFTNSSPLGPKIIIKFLPFSSSLTTPFNAAPPVPNIIGVGVFSSSLGSSFFFFLAASFSNSSCLFASSSASLAILSASNLASSSFLAIDTPKSPTILSIVSEISYSIYANLDFVAAIPANNSSLSILSNLC